MNPIYIDDDSAGKRELAAYRSRLRTLQAAIHEDRAAGELALRRLLPIAQGPSGQCKHVARFLLGLYNGRRFPFNLNDLRGLDCDITLDCLAVLKMDTHPLMEVHEYFPNGGQVFERLAADWGFNKEGGAA